MITTRFFGVHEKNPPSLATPRIKLLLLRVELHKGDFF